MPEPKAKIINGLSFAISQPYEAGHVLNEAEARVLNQTRSENIGNNTRAAIKEMQDAGKDLAEIAVLVTQADGEYEFTLSTARQARTVDPYEREARKIAKEFVKEKLAETGRKLNVAPEGLTDDEWAEKVEAEIDRLAGEDAVLKAARKIVDDKRKASDKLREAIGESTI